MCALLLRLEWISVRRNSCCFLTDQLTNIFADSFESLLQRLSHPKIVIEIECARTLSLIDVAGVAFISLSRVPLADPCD